MYRSSIVMLLVACAWIATAGCGGRQQSVANTDDKARTIIASSGGNWNALSASDQQYLVDKLGHGSPVAAQMTFHMMARNVSPAARIKH